MAWVALDEDDDQPGWLWTVVSPDLVKLAGDSEPLDRLVTEQ
jgi:hypothetical protein